MQRSYNSRTSSYKKVQLSTRYTEKPYAAAKYLLKRLIGYVKSDVIESHFKTVLTLVDDEVVHRVDLVIEVTHAGQVIIHSRGRGRALTGRGGRSGRVCALGLHADTGVAVRAEDGGGGISGHLAYLQPTAVPVS